MRSKSCYANGLEMHGRFLGTKLSHMLIFLSLLSKIGDIRLSAMFSP